LIKVSPHPVEVGHFNAWDNQLATAGKAWQAGKDVQRTSCFMAVATLLCSSNKEGIHLVLNGQTTYS